MRFESLFIIYIDTQLTSTDVLSHVFGRFTSVHVGEQTKTESSTSAVRVCEAVYEYLVVSRVKDLANSCAQLIIDEGTPRRR